MAPAKHQAEPTLTVTKAARILGVHPNTVRTWSDQGRLPFLRINERGDRRYRAADLHRFLAEIEQGPARERARRTAAARSAPSVLPIGPDVVEERTRPHDVRFVPALLADSGLAAAPAPAYARFMRRPPGELAALPTPGVDETGYDGFDRRRAAPELEILTSLLALVEPGNDPLALMTAAVELLHDRAGHDLVAVLQLAADRTALLPRVARGVGANRLDAMPTTRGLPARVLAAGAALIETGPPPHADEWLAPGRLLHGRIVAPIGFGAAWGFLVVGDEGSAAIHGWAPAVEAIGRLLGVALALAGGTAGPVRPPEQR